MIEVKHLTKKYGDNTAVEDLSFTIEHGHVYGFLGPNGAGKSTTMNIMTGCLSATSGSVTINGFDIFEQPVEAKKLIGYLPEIPPLYPERTPREYLRFVAEAKCVEKGLIKEQIDRVCRETRIESVVDRLIGNLSKGYRQRVGFAQALLGNPEVLILDEPTVGLDPKQIIEIRSLIQDLGKRHTVILSSHILSEVSAICDTIMIISKGRLVACDTPDHLEQLFAGETTITALADAPVKEVQPITAMLGQRNTKVNNAGKNRSRITIRPDGTDADDVCRNMFFTFGSAGIALLQINTEKASLEDVFIELTEGDDVVPGPEEISIEEKETTANESNIQA